MAREKTHRTVIQVRVSPRSSRNQIVGLDNRVLRVKLTAPPVQGRANKALKEFLAKSLGVAKGDVEIITGKTSRTKLVQIQGISPVDLSALLNRHIQ